LKNLSGLSFDISLSDQVPIGVHRGLPGDIDQLSVFYYLGKPRPGVGNSYGLNNFSRHILFLL
jgi:hypothetical protein